MALSTGCPVIYPLYTLAPAGTAAQCIQGGRELLVKIHRDDRYRDHRIVVTGASAGAWIALRLVLALSENALGQTASSSKIWGVTYPSGVGEVRVKIFMHASNSCFGYRIIEAMQN